MLRRLGLLAAAAFALLPQFAAAVPYTGELAQDLHFFETASGFVNPAVLVGFNPQPEPPGDRSRVDLGNPIQPTITLEGAGLFTIVFGMHSPGGGGGAGRPYSFLLPDGDPVVRGDHAFYQFHAFGDGSVFQISFDIGGFTGGWAGFNPQPEPPGDFGQSFVAFGFIGDPSLAVTIEEGTIDNGAFVRDSFLTFREVPEPAGALPLIAFGLFALGCLRGRTEAS